MRSAQCELAARAAGSAASATSSIRVKLLEHVADPRANLVALRAERGELGARALRFSGLRARHLQLRAEPRVLLGGARLLGAGASEFVVGARVVGARTVEDGHELLELLLEPVDGFEIHRRRRDRCLCHCEYLVRRRVYSPGITGYLRAAPCAAAS